MRRPSSLTPSPPCPPWFLLAETAARGLSENLATLQGLLKQLVELAEEKLAGMRAADGAALQGCAAREAVLLERVFELDEQRQAALAQLAQALHVEEVTKPRSHEATEGRGLGGAGLSEIANRLPEPLASVLRARSVALREIAEKLRQKNAVAARVAHNLQSHVRAVFAELAKANQESVVYGPKGQHEQARVRSCLDAVG